jgi:predicted dehydrogenase
MLQTETIDIAWVAVPSNVHGPIESALMARDIPFLVEKPLGLDVATPERIAADVARSGLVVAVGYNWRALDFLPEVRHLLAARPARLVVARWLAGTPWARWWQRTAEGGGQIIEQTTHLIDISRHLLGPARVLSGVGNRLALESFPESDVLNSTIAVMEFEQGALGTFASSATLARPNAIDISFLSESQVITIALGGRWPSPVWSLSVENETGRTYREAGADPYVAQNAAFVQAVLTGDPTGVLCSYDDALASHRIAIAMNRLASGSVVDSQAGPSC